MSIRIGPKDWADDPLQNEDLAKYPFLNDVSEYIRQTHFDFEEYNRPEFKDIIETAIERIETEASGRLYEKLDRFQREVFIFLATLIIVKSIGIESVLRKYSLFEAMRAEKFLTEDLKRERNEQKRRLLLFKIFKELFNVDIDIDADDERLFKVKITDYLKRASHFHEQEWKLINRMVNKGYVYLDADETVRLFRNELGALVYDKVKMMQLLTLPEALKTKIEELRTKMTHRYEYRATAVTDYPPCVKHALEVMGRGENLPHSARVMLATYMLAIGKPVDEIVMMYENAPDFNEKITRYQVEHLAGMKGSRTKYSVPSCDKLRNENLCFATAECDGIINPIQFGRKMRK
ncbi:DNA primase, large subunit [Candidatus Nitrososphaera gargensis Ga9.2]|uniref:DNA primase large subunit PriL n=1 Tax=Nitrososphaera gargensis (strain Ga9.2) TaxID=1237085 RepID=K0IFG0_NITGG|nr:DNA primase large subunit [Candidatus Nitrososphaera gargensis]AFU58550.1 DNA primase, large subunit [Candidatus Nitrososphaera gargensis Ga9.2]